MNQPLKPIQFVVDELLSQGLHLLAGAPKSGKSWLALWICLQVAKGEKVWEFETLQSEVLYLCLEDSFARIQSRLFEITDEAPPTLHFAIMSDTIGSGVEMQIENFLKEYSELQLAVLKKKLIKHMVFLNKNGISYSENRTFERQEFTLTYDSNDDMTVESCPQNLPSLPSALSVKTETVVDSIDTESEVA